jgi:hypothetical protein
MGHIEVCREDKDSLERGIKGGGKETFTTQSTTIHFTQVVVRWLLASPSPKERKQKKFTPPSPPLQKKIKLVLATTGLVLSLIFRNFYSSHPFVFILYLG